MEPELPSSELPGPLPIFWLGTVEAYGRTPLVEWLMKLAFEGKITLYQFPMEGHTDESVAALVGEKAPRGLFQRPTTWPNIPLRVEDFSDRCFIANIGVGHEHLQEFLDKVPDWLVLPDADGPAVRLSAKFVAQLTLILAVCLQRSVPLAAAMAGTEFESFHNQYQVLIRSGSLLGKNWLCLAGGRQVRELLPLLRAFGIRKVTIWVREKDAGKFASWFATCTEPVNPQRVAASISASPSNHALLDLGDFIIEGTNDYDSSARAADVVSIHAGKPGPPTPGSPLPLDDTFFSLLKPDACVINTARGRLVNEAAVVRALREGRLHGYATDVLYPEAERQRDPAFSPLWEYYLELCGDQQMPPLKGAKLIILPHIAGSVEELFAAFIEELVPQMLSKLGLPQP